MLALLARCAKVRPEMRTMMRKQSSARAEIEALQSGYRNLGYVSDEQIATALYLAQQLQKPY